MAYVNDEYERNKVVTLRITSKVYNDLSNYVKVAAKKHYWPRKTLSSVSAEMIEYCLKNNIDVFQR